MTENTEYFNYMVKELGLTQAEFAKMINYTENSISLMATGKVEPNGAIMAYLKLLREGVPLKEPAETPADIDPDSDSEYVHEDTEESEAEAGEYEHLFTQFKGNNDSS